MKHHARGRKFGRERNQRSALLRSLMRSLVLKGRITTSEAKAKEIRPMIEKLLTRGKVATLHNRRLLITELGDPAVAAKLMKTAENYTARAGGYVRIVKMMPRKGDASARAMIEFI